MWVLFVLAAANGAFLYFLPGHAQTDYAWSIKPPVNAAFIGAGFLAGTLATGLVLFATTPLALVLDAAAGAVGAGDDAARGDDHPPRRFKFDYPPTWVWAFVYAGVPFAVPVLVPPARAPPSRGRPPIRGCASCALSAR